MKERKENAENMVVLFDGACNLCNRSVQFIMDRDRKKRFHFASMQCPLGKRLMEAHGMNPDDMRSLVLVSGGRIYTKSDAALRIAQELSGVWPMVGLMRLIPRPIRDWSYNRVAGNRYRWFGRSNSCRAPSDEERDRFLC
jgi:predicted DCC family thiol-disulfide oxidoreductase YuxK